MAKYRRSQLLEMLDTLTKVNEAVKNGSADDQPKLIELLVQCQELAGCIGSDVQTRGEKGARIGTILEAYCRNLYLLALNLPDQEQRGQLQKKISVQLSEIEKIILSGLPGLKKEIVFLPYKASMWDSLESIWKAASEDEDCEAYVVPIPYFDKNPDGSLGQMHDEKNQYPADVPVTSWREYQISVRRPDVIYIHNPYDNWNYVTSIHPAYYSRELRKYTNVLVYVPYYATTGDMSEGQELCPAYLNADYIVIQSEKYRKFFDKRIPDKKFLAMGSPKFDSVIQKCKNPPRPPREWEEKKKGRKVYFYNTSIGGMLGNTESFLKKMRYVFDLFKGREDACLLWRPHPLLESTFASMRKELKPQYDALKREFLEEDIGIYDETPDIESTIAFSDVYIGDAATSVTSLFGVTGKPLFLLNNDIHTLPEEDDWRGEKTRIVWDGWGDDRYQVTATNQLWFSEKNDYHYRFYMDLESDYSRGGYYFGAVELHGRIYVTPANAQHLLIIKGKAIRRLEFKEEITRPGAFYNYWYNENYLFLFPYQYPKLIRFDLETEELRYIDGVQPFNVRNVDGEWRTGGIGLYGNELIFSSPTDSQFLFMDVDTLKMRRLVCPSQCGLGTQGIVADGERLWILPLNGLTLTCWNPQTGEVREYDDRPQNFRCVRWPQESECEERPFGNIAVSREGGRETILLSPSWGNLYLSLDSKTGKMEEWKPPIEFTNRGKNGYFLSGGMGSFVITLPQRGKPNCRIWYAPERRLYDINIETKEYKEVEIVFDYEDLKAHEPGFMEDSEWMQYCLCENAFHSLKDLLDGTILGEPFDRERQLLAFSKINADTDGTCGRRVHEFVMKWGTSK